MKAKEEGVTLAQPRAGVALIEKHIELLKYLEQEGGADLLPTTIDSYTRQNRYDECEIGINESIKAGRSLLNGFPAVNHGVKGCRQVFEAVNIPLEARHGTPDARLLAEITHASGWTSNEGGGISYNIPYAKNATLTKSILDWQYCDRLVGFYEEQGISINREPFGPLTGTLVPPSTSNAVAIIEALLAAEQGVKNITVGYGQCGNLIQDVAAIRALEEQCDEYLKANGYKDVYLTTVLHQWMGGFPENEAKAFGVIATGAVAAALAGATKVIVKTPHEAVGIPTKEANAMGIRTTKMALNLLRGQRLPMSQELKIEMEVIKAETKCMLDKVHEIGKGDMAIGAVKGFEMGIIDVPFTQELINFNMKKLEDRAKFENREISFQMTIDDIFAVGKGVLIGRPEKK